MTSKRYSDPELILGDYFKSQRNNLGINTTRVAKMMHSSWGLKLGGAEQFIHFCESGGLFYGLKKTIRGGIHRSNGPEYALDLNAYERRISDVIHAYGMQNNKDLLKAIREVQPKFKLQKSKVKPLEKLVLQ